MDNMIKQSGTFFDDNESYLIRQEGLPSTCSYVVTYLSGDDVCSISPLGYMTELTSGTLIGMDYEIRTGNGRVEIRSSTGVVFRLGKHSSFSIKKTIAGECPVYYGNVFISNDEGQQVLGGGKYRTSCYVPGHTNLLIKPVTDTIDCYYVLNYDINIVEFDENGRQFFIDHADQYTKLELSFDDSMPMRKKYTTLSKHDLTDDEITELYTDWVSPVFWR
ncbi:hypothetical protein [Lentilactobacillus sp. Marseille-Q4993]|uniref:hypothetical protein n=1 Tax=Lentilactobacillus sp. Marseille-Q4993 TaxID=3039492 RepID=UPI0024BC1DE4|nr:hypothetical protein [Lentilactobacillus sp. Marseille-Q4993]